jgi:hypothetical protein
MAMCVLRNEHADSLIFENNEIIINITNYKPKLIIKRWGNKYAHHLEINN